VSVGCRRDHRTRRQGSGEYFSGYLIEYSLSNRQRLRLALIFTFFAVPALYQHRVLFWGIFGALVLRAIFIFAGVALITKFEWILYVFGAFLIYTATSCSWADDEINPEENIAFRTVKRLVPSTPELDGQKLFTLMNGRRLATPLFAVLVLVETTDVLSPSIRSGGAGVSATVRCLHLECVRDPRLRALYFLLADLHARFNTAAGLAVILAFVGVKMIIHHWLEISAACRWW